MVRSQPTFWSTSALLFLPIAFDRQFDFLAWLGVIEDRIELVPVQSRLSVDGRNIVAHFQTAAGSRCAGPHQVHVYSVHWIGLVVKFCAEIAAGRGRKGAGGNCAAARAS